MPFYSLDYFLFLPIVYLAHHFAGERARWCVLLAASLLFYAALNVPYLLVVLILVIIATYCFGIWLDRTSAEKAKRAFLWSGIAANVLILIIMKYLPFRLDRTIVAIGVSYYVFQAISYLIDIYLGIRKPERHFGYFSLYLAFFPKLLQGPIERAGDLLPQIRAKYEFNYVNMRSGLLLFTWGLFKKVVIADRLGLYVDTVYNNVHAFEGLSLLLATYAYALQIFMDFSGYTDMALGSALFFNIKLTQNFNSPYIATSVADFWRRWHISFSRWILDYIFRPLQMRWRNRQDRGTAAALIVTFLVVGIWHGASWGFVIWGLLHGVYMASSVFYRPYQKRLHKALHIEKTGFLKAWQIFVTFNLVSFAWVFFRAGNLADAVYIVTNMFNGAKRAYSGFLLSQGKAGLLIISISILLYMVISTQAKKMQGQFQDHILFRWALYYCFTFYIILFAVRAKAAFIYMGF